MQSFPNPTVAPSHHPSQIKTHLPLSLPLPSQIPLSLTHTHTHKFICLNAKTLLDSVYIVKDNIADFERIIKMRPDWNGPRHGLCHGFLYNLCSLVSSCFYVFCCCWLLEDCCMGRRSLPGPPFGYSEPPPPPPPPPNVQHVGHIGPGPGLLGSLLGQSGQSGPQGPPSQPGPYGFPGERGPF